MSNASSAAAEAEKGDHQSVSSPCTCNGNHSITFTRREPIKEEEKKEFTSVEEVSFQQKLPQQNTLSLDLVLEDFTQMNNHTGLPSHSADHPPASATTTATAVVDRSNHNSTVSSSTKPQSSSSHSRLLCSKLKHNSSEFRIYTLRILTVFSLICTGALCASFGYILLSSSENNLYLDQYNSLVDGMYQSLLDGVESRVSAGQSFAAAFGGYCPESSSWPNCWIPYSTFDRITLPLADSLNMKSTGMLPIVRPEEVESFERFAKQAFDNSSFPSTTGTHPFGFGIAALNGTERYHDTTGYNPASPYQLLVPTLEYRMEFAGSLMINAHSVASRQVPLDEIITCYRTSADLSKCSGTVTDFVQLGIDSEARPSSSVIQPINPANNRSDLVGFISIVINWDTILRNGAPSVMSDIYVVLSSGKLQYTYYFEDGDAIYEGGGDLHDDDYNHLKKSYELSPSAADISQLEYSVTFYPSDKFYNTYHSDTPFLVCLISLLIVLGTSLIFLVYDFFVKRESLEQTRILEAKQTYVRFISHVSSVLFSSSLPLLLSSSLTLSPCVCVACVVCL
jgi:hypothetical protein